MKDANRLLGSRINGDSAAKKVVSHFCELDAKVRDRGVHVDFVRISRPMSCFQMRAMKVPAVEERQDCHAAV